MCKTIINPPSHDRWACSLAIKVLRHLSRYPSLPRPSSDSMPSAFQPYEVLLDLTNDTHDSVTIQLLRTYGRNHSDAVVLLNPTESITLVLESGSIYQYAVKMRSKVASITASGWRDIHCRISNLFATGSTGQQPLSGVSVDRLWKDYQAFI